MDIVLRLWDEDKEEVITCYLTSGFLGPATAENLLRTLKNCLQKLNLHSLLQVSMDGPSVNMKFLCLLKEELMETPSDPVLLDIGTCGLHVVHDAFKTGHRKVGWQVQQFLRAIYNLFKNVPYRRALFTEITGCGEFPKKFCSIRWLENSAVSERALLLIPHLKKFVLDVVPKPSCASFQTLQKCLKDPLLEAKTCFFMSIASQAEPFLQAFQSNAPLAPFLYDDFSTIIVQLMRRVLKTEVLDCGVKNIQKIDLTKKDNILTARNVEIGFAAKHAVKKNKVCEKEDLVFRNECSKFLLEMINKRMEQGPIKYRLCFGIGCLNLDNMGNLDSGSRRLDAALEAFIQCNRITTIQAENIKREYVRFCEESISKNLLKDFRHTNQRLGTFLFNTMKASNCPLSNLKMFVKMVLILSHGNAAVERVFSVNKECLEENLKEESLVAKRLVHDAIQNAGGLKYIVITKCLIHSTRNAAGRYKEALKKKKPALQDQNEKEDVKRKAALQLKEAKLKKQKLICGMNRQLQTVDSEIEEIQKIMQ